MYPQKARSGRRVGEGGSSLRALSSTMHFYAIDGASLSECRDAKDERSEPLRLALAVMARARRGPPRSESQLCRRIAALGEGRGLGTQRRSGVAVLSKVRVLCLGNRVTF